MQDFDKVGLDARRLLDNVSKVVIGQPDVVQQVLVCLLSAGHVLIEGVPSR